MVYVDPVAPEIAVPDPDAPEYHWYVYVPEGDSDAVSVNDWPTSTVFWLLDTETLNGALTSCEYDELADPASVEIVSEIVYDPATEALHVGLATLVDENVPPDALHEYVPPLTSSKFALDDRSTVPPVAAGFGEPDIDVMVGASGAPVYVAVYTVPAADPVPDVGPLTEYPGTAFQVQLIVGFSVLRTVSWCSNEPPGAAVP